MAPEKPCAKYQYVVTPNGPKILPVLDPSYKDEESPADYNAGGYLPVKVGDTFKSGRYQVVRKLGWGHFSTVWLVKDTQEQCHSALKVVKSAGRYAETARDEIKLLSRVASVSPTHPGRTHIVSFLDSFVSQGPESSHVCIVFEPLGENLLGLIERNKKKGVPKALIRVIARQVLLGLQYLHDECDLVHTDIKPENILIAIPDVETHIHAELSTSPTPISRRVGVPLPTKSRTGVTIPLSQQTIRRQVQIFNSQPLASPSRSVIDLTRSVPGSLKLGLNTSDRSHENVNNTMSRSLISENHVGAATGLGNTSTSGTAKSLSSRFTSGLTTSVKQPFGNTILVAHKHNPLSPSTSSSSSSISSTAASVIAGASSVISTPPTSLSYSLGIAVAGFIGISKTGDRPTNNDHHSREKKLNHSREGIPVKGRKTKGKISIEDELEEATSTSWKDAIGKPNSWSEKIVPGLSSSYKLPAVVHTKSKLSQVQSPHHSQPRLSIASSTFWKDPGTAAPAPAVVVSAVAGADGSEDRSSFDFPPTSRVPPTSRGGTLSASETSATAAITRPSRTVTPVDTPSPSKKPPSLIKKAVLNTLTDTVIQPFGSSTTPAHIIAKSTPSLLSRTAPIRPTSLKPTPPSSRSPPQHTSLLSAHKHSLPVTTSASDLHCRTTTHTHTDTSLVIDVPPAPVPLAPTTPPPTPVESPSTFSSITHPPSSHASVHPIEVPLTTNPFPAAVAPLISVKIADLGNATPSDKHYTEDIQTRQYRAPEAILGRRDWDARADIWSVACVVFELLTSEFLFDPHGQGERFTKDDDHMAQIIELLGDFPLEVKMGGKYSRELFDHVGNLRYIHELRPWPLNRVMTEKYGYSDSDAAKFSDFLLPMLAVDTKERAHARDMLDHPWLSPSPDDEELIEW
ncbi:hypothetical protein H2248_000497 [Termitomyces sp. 'cryptogamus']|nr:hypothetical protein H2248_000497 [Termitomyces sp. 'cryptogamus']